MTEAIKRPGGGLGDKAARVLSAELQNLMAALGERAGAKLAEQVAGLTDRLTRAAAEGGSPSELAAAVGLKKLAEGESPVKAALSAGLAGVKERFMQAIGRGGKGGERAKGGVKVTNIVESADVGVPLRVAYNQWTQVSEFPTFMKKVENVEQASEEKQNWKAQVFWSHRTWEATIIEQVPDRHIVWRSKGEKGHVDGTVTFSELAPNLTRILLVLEYYPQGLFERTGNIWRAQGRRVRLEFKHFVRHVMTRTILQQDEVEGWRGEIRDGEVVRDHETALEEERRQREEDEYDEQAERGDEYGEGGDQSDEEADDYDEYAEGADQYDEDWAEEPEAEHEPEPEEEPERPLPRARRPRSSQARPTGRSAGRR
jgi:uncharacterized membrane protein